MPRSSQWRPSWPVLATAAFAIACRSVHPVPRPAVEPDVAVLDGASKVADEGLVFGVTLGQADPPCKASPWSPEPIARISPSYPAEARAAGVEGRVVVLLDIDAEGRVTAVSVKESAGHGLDEAAMEAARRLRFRPPCGVGEGGATGQPWTFTFRLE